MYTCIYTYTYTYIYINTHIYITQYKHVFKRSKHTNHSPNSSVEEQGEVATAADKVQRIRDHTLRRTRVRVVFQVISLLQHVAVCCSVLQIRPFAALVSVSCRLSGYFSVAACCSVLQCVAVCCSVLQCVAVCCRLVPWPHSCPCRLSGYLSNDSSCCSVVQCVTVY